MEVAAILAFALQDWLDAGLIVAILLLNAAVGWYQEKQAADVVASLKGDIAMKALVIRQGREEEIRARELVPGDIVSRLIISQPFRDPRFWFATKSIWLTRNLSDRR